ncbi:MAG: WD40/YVTN/BNR-like repeat-containing protein [Streptosporangiaceae bacterium]
MIVATGACGGAAPGPARGTVAHGGGALTVLSASFASASVGWLLATPCAGQVQTCRTIVVRKTVDGGRAWSAVRAPDVPPADMFQGSPPANAVGTILFTSARTGWAFGPALWQTRDGGLTWRKMKGPGGPVEDLRVTGDRLLALTSRCVNGGSACTYLVYSAPVGLDNWRVIPGATVTGVRSAQLAVSGGMAYVFAIAGEPGKPWLLAGPANGSAPWRPRPDPCTGAWSGALAAAAGGWLVLGCGLEPGAGNQVKTAYLSDDEARSWRKLASPPFGGYLGGASMSARGTIFLSGERMDVYISWDRGRSWHESPSLENAAGLAGAGFPLVGLTVTDTRGFAFQEGAAPQQVWLSRDSGHHWTPVTVH